MAAKFQKGQHVYFQQNQYMKMRAAYVSSASFDGGCELRIRVNGEISTHSKVSVVDAHKQVRPVIEGNAEHQEFAADFHALQRDFEAGGAKEARLQA